MKSTSTTIALLCCIWATSATHAAGTQDKKKQPSDKQRIEALTNEQARLREIIEIQQRQLQEMSQRFNASRHGEPISNQPYTYP